MGAAMSDQEKREFASRKFKWLLIVAQDPTLTGRLPNAIAMAMASRYLDPEKRVTLYMTHDSLADDLKANRRNIRTALGKLIKAGWVGCERRGRGAGDPNRYWMILKEVADDPPYGK